MPWFFFRKRGRTPSITIESHLPQRLPTPGLNGRTAQASRCDDPKCLALQLQQIQVDLAKQISQSGLDILVAIGAQAADGHEALRATLDSTFAAGLARVREDLDKARIDFLERSVTHFGRRTDERWERLSRDVSRLMDAVARQALLTPIVNQLLAIYDRIPAEIAYQVALCRRLEARTLGGDLRTIVEQCESAQRSYMAELLLILTSLGLQRIETSGGPFNPQCQYVVGVEATSQPELDGHVARVLSAGFLWNGALYRPEKIIVYKLEKKA